MRGRMSLRERLAVVMLAALLPLFVISGWVTIHDSRAAAEAVMRQLEFSASLLAANQDRAVDAAEQMLAAVAAIPELRTYGRSTCQPYFESLRARYPMYTNIGLIAVDGRVVCHAQGAMGDAPAADRDYFKAALSQRRFVMGQPIVGRLTARAALPFALPVLENGEVAGVVFATLDLGRAASALAPAGLPEGARVLVANRAGRILMEYPAQQARPAPRDADHDALLEAGRSFAPSSGEGTNLAGEKRIYAIAPGRPVGAEGFVVRVGVPRQALAGAVDAYPSNALLVVALTLFGAVAATWWIGGRMFVKPARQILGTVRRMEQGRLDSRVPLHGNSQRGEFARIGAAFNLMADSLQLRQRDLENELGRSRKAFGALDLVLNSMQEGLVAVTRAGKFLMYNQAAARLLPLEGAPGLPELWPEHFGFFHPDGVTLYVPDDLPFVRSALGETGSLEQVYVRNALVPEGRLLHCSWQPIRDDEGIRGGLVVFTDVTQLQRLEAEQAAQFAQLQETQRKLIEAQRIGRVGNWELDLQTGRLSWSDEVFELFGLAPEDFDGTLTSFSRWVHPDDVHLLKPARDSALRDGQLMDVEYRVQRPDGTVAWMHQLGEARRADGGEPIWFGGVVQDISNRKRNEQALLASERELHGYTVMLQRSAYAAQAITAHSTVEATLHEVAMQACHVIGTQEAAVSLVGAHESTRVWSGTPAPAGAPTLKVPLLTRSGAAAGELRLTGKLQGQFTQHDEYVALEMAQLACIAIDNARLFTEVRELNATLEARIAQRTAELARQEQLYRTLAEQAPEVVWNTDLDGNVTYLNRAWYELVGGDSADWLGQGWLRRIHADDLRGVLDNWNQSRQTLQAYTGIRRILARSGSYHTMSYKAAPVLNEHGQVTSWVGIDADITEVKAIESALRSSNQELEAFSYSVSHDLRAPLGAIAGFSRALAATLEGSVNQRAAHYLDRVQAGVVKMEQLIESLLSLSKVVRAPLHWGSVDLSAIARDTVEGLQMQQHDRPVAVHVACGLETHGDARLLRIVLENLLGNAWKFSSGRDGARIEVGRLEGENVFFVRDNGVGFDMAYASKLFTAFHRLHSDSEFPGTGIGLATVRRIIARHQGRVWAESEVGKGTCFYFSLTEAEPPSWLQS